MTSAAPIRIAAERRSWFTRRAVFRHWQKLTMMIETMGAAATVRRVAPALVGASEAIAREEAWSEAGKGGPDLLSAGGGVPPGGTAKGMPDSFPYTGLCRLRLHPRIGGF
jgi:hypothetical protein